jgi:hypothetical protein
MDRGGLEARSVHACSRIATNMRGLSQSERCPGSGRDTLRAVLAPLGAAIPTYTIMTNCRRT